MAGLRHTQRTRSTVIREFRRVGRVDLACAAAGCDRTDHYRWLKQYPAYAAEFENAREEVAGLLEDEAVRRAYHGTQKPVSVGGKVMVITEFSDRLLEFLLKCRNPEVFADRVKQDVSGVLIHDFGSLTPAISEHLTALREACRRFSPKSGVVVPGNPTSNSSGEAGSTEA